MLSMERVPELVNHVRRHTGHAGLFENGGLFECFRGLKIRGR